METATIAAWSLDRSLALIEGATSQEIQARTGCVFYETMGQTSNCAIPHAMDVPLRK